MGLSIMSRPAELLRFRSHQAETSRSEPTRVTKAVDFFGDIFVGQSAVYRSTRVAVTCCILLTQVATREATLRLDFQVKRTAPSGNERPAENVLIACYLRQPRSFRIERLRPRTAPIIEFASDGFSATNTLTSDQSRFVVRNATGQVQILTVAEAEIGNQPRQYTIESGESVTVTLRVLNRLAAAKMNGSKHVLTAAPAEMIAAMTDNEGLANVEIPSNSEVMVRIFASKATDPKTAAAVADVQVQCDEIRKAGDFKISDESEAGFKFKAVSTDGCHSQILLQVLIED